MMKLAVIGGFGKMGKRIIEFALAEKDIQVVCAVEQKGSPVLGKKICECFPAGDGNGHGAFTEDLDGNADVVIDFSSPQSTMTYLKLAAQKKTAYVIGTTGLSEEQIAEVRALSQKIPVVQSPNMSIGVNLLFQLTREVAAVLGPQGYDIELVELHHNKKKDSPSGTAKKLLQMAAEGGKLNVKDAVYGREGILGERKKSEIGVLSVRAGDIVGEHTVYFVGNNERIELTHRAHSRDTFARGALAAARFIIGKKPGIYDMQDVLGMK
ncbi:MAG: 4-hydroxy-tetrahydrodipicolinate reductase [Candidatus Aureabacteria bacterium]|nr:4-hydroxy-tetrahydrodipicolinate reductase [Candidatus Auribacterota bacterium]